MRYKVTITVDYDMDGSPSPDMTNEQVEDALIDSISGAVSVGLLDIGPIIDNYDVKVEHVQS